MLKIKKDEWLQAKQMVKMKGERTRMNKQLQDAEKYSYEVRMNHLMQLQNKIYDKERKTIMYQK